MEITSGQVSKMRRRVVTSPSFMSFHFLFLFYSDFFAPSGACLYTAKAGARNERLPRVWAHPGAIFHRPKDATSTTHANQKRKHFSLMFEHVHGYVPVYTLIYYRPFSSSFTALTSIRESVTRWLFELDTGECLDITSRFELTDPDSYRSP